VLPGYAKSVASGINDSGQVIGSLSTSLSGGSTAAFLWENGVMTDLNTLIPPGSGWTLKSASDINNAGQIVCWGEAPNGQYHGCLLTPNPCMMVTLTPYMAPIVLPAIGGSFDFNIEVSNPGTTGSQADVWCDVTLPTGSQFGPTLGPANLFLSPGFTINRDRIQDVPGSAPAGMYVYHGYVGTYPTYVCNQDSFTFEKLGTDGGEWLDEWLNTGEPLDEPLMQTPDAIPKRLVLYQAHPNPFNPSTTINYQLSAADQIILSVYDINGRRVAELVNGWRDMGIHEVTFDGSDFASGIYLYRLDAGPFSAVGKMMLVK
jgi:probable HAF family extracellular repeat protein